MLDQHLEAARLESVRRFAALRSFIVESANRTERGDTSFRVSQYSGWVLLAYAATEAAITSLGKAAMLALSDAASTPDGLPPAVRFEHRARMLRHLSVDAGKNGDTPAFLTALRSLDANDWARYSPLMRVDGNVWPDTIRELLGRIGADAPWMSHPTLSGTESASSRLGALVEERNQIAHGQLPEDLLSASLMCVWVEDVEHFVRLTFATSQARIAEMFIDLALDSIGVIDDAAPAMSAETVPLARVDAELRPGDHVLIVTDGSPRGVKVGQVASLQSDGVVLEEARPGDARVAVTLNRDASGCALYRAL